MCCEETLVRKYGWIFVVMTTFLITFVPVSTHYYIFNHWLPFHNRSLMLWTGPFDLFVLSIWYNYYKGCTTHPGRVPKSYQPKNKSKKPRWCNDCLTYKAPRSHHCSYCKQCILRMDHHCPWLNNCVGHFNLPYFVRFVVSVAIASSLCLFLVGMRILDVIRYQNDIASFYQGSFQQNSTIRYTPSPSEMEILMIIVNVIILFVLLITVGILSLYQLYYISQNTTTIESFENSKIEDLKRKQKIPQDLKYPYDLGWYKNVCFVLGDRWYLWLLPFGAQGDGLEFETTTKNPWPPKEYYLYKKYPYGKQKDLKHVRRDSEGYVVKMLSAEEREQLVQAPPKIEAESSTDYDSLDEYDDREEDGIPRAKMESDEEPLAVTKRHLKKKIK
ncbi:DHHC palmitoyltransferase-domain-containing protein [Gorgonomyces haynaldii]|nr:DHHC palmitoyltransferase-domain-containing protein [Gorgonomyces haynaldii]